jgi:hypothetical protein
MRTERKAKAESKSRFPEGMTDRKAKSKKQILRGNDRKKGKGKGSLARVSPWAVLVRSLRDAAAIWK